MHIPNSMLHGAICPVTAAVSAAGIATASYLAYRCHEKSSMTGFSAVTAMIFAVQMLNYPISHGTSGHLLGATLAASILGVPFALLSMAIVLSVQAIFFADGGINTLGANILNMGLIGTGLGGSLFYLLTKNKVNRLWALAIASWLSVVLAAVACSLELSIAKAVSLKDALPAMIGVHVLIGTGEAVAAVVLISILAKGYAKRSMILALVGALLTPLSSQLPDGLTWILTHRANYQVITSPLDVASQMTTALAGIFLVFGLTLIGAKLIQQIFFNRRPYARN